MNNDPDAIFIEEMKKLNTVISQKPDIVMTHFIPTAFGIPRKYEDEISNAFFYFNADEYLIKTKHKSIWLAGHTHDTGRKVIQLGSKKVILLLNPIGYPMEINGHYNLNSRKLSAMLDF